MAWSRREHWHSDGMGTSFVDFRDHGFWTSDGKLEIWLHLLTLAVTRRAERAEWLDQAGQHWHEQSTAGFTGCVSADLDRWIGHQADRVVVVAELAREARRALLEAGVLRCADLNSAGVGGPDSSWTADLDAAVVLPVADAFTALLDGRIAWDSKTSPVL